jgi:hypothetical protein
MGALNTAVDTRASSDRTAAETWIDLSEPVAADAVDAAAAARQAHRVASQQDRFGEQLRKLGIVEVARVRHARNAILVRATPAQLDLLRAIPGVVRVRPVDTLHPPKPMP